MVQIWVNAIINNKRKFSETPSKLKDAVRQALIDMDREDLIEE